MIIQDVTTKASVLRRSVILACLFIVALASCDPGPEPKLIGISVAPSLAYISINESRQFKAVGMLSDNSTSDEQWAVTWNSSNPDIASISESGLATGLAAGTTTITATRTYNGTVYSAASLLNVVNSTLVSIEVTPTNPSSSLNAETQFTAMGTYDDNSTRDLTKTVLWSSSSAIIASIGNSTDLNGRATALSVGQTIIMATDPASNISGTTMLTVSP